MGGLKGLLMGGKTERLATGETGALATTGDELLSEVDIAAGGASAGAD